MIDADTEAFNDYMIALKMPQGTDLEKCARKEAMQNGLKVAIEVPFRLVKTVNQVWPTLSELAEVGNINCKSDLQVAARCLVTAVQGAVDNVEINMKDLEDESYVAAKRKECNEAVQVAKKACDQVLSVVEDRKE